MWQLIVAEAVLFGISWVLHKQFDEAPPKTKPSQGDIPRIDDGAPVPLLYGRCRVKAPLLVFAGNGIATPVGDGPDFFRYSLDMLYVIGVPFYGGIATLNTVFASDYAIFPVAGLPFFGTAFAGRYNFSGTTLFNIYGGTETDPNGISGGIEFFDGRPSQTISNGINPPTYSVGDPGSPLTDALTVTQAVMTANALYHNKPPNIDATLIPSYRSQVICCLFQWEIGRSPNLTSYGFEVTSLSTGTLSHFGNSLPIDADPIAVIFDLMTSPWGKLNLPVSKIDLPSFQVASDTLFAESHGYSRAIESADDSFALIKDVLKQIDGTMYEEPSTGKIVIRLIRKNYNVADLDDVNPGNADLRSYEVQGWMNLPNQVRLTFTDRQANYADGVEIGQDGAGVSLQGGRLRSIDLKVPGCCDRTLAKTLASRALGAVSRPMAKATVVANRSFYLKRPGDPVTMSWPNLGIDKMVMRVGTIDF